MEILASAGPPKASEAGRNPEPLARSESHDSGRSSSPSSNPGLTEGSRPVSIKTEASAETIHGALGASGAGASSGSGGSGGGGTVGSGSAEATSSLSTISATASLIGSSRLE